jgi:3D (Asp-Asp-Asp) domain-containing protein
MAGCQTKNILTTKGTKNTKAAEFTIQNPQSQIQNSQTLPARRDASSSLSSARGSRQMPRLTHHRRLLIADYAGTGSETPQPSRSFMKSATKVMIVTAYCPCTQCCGKRACGITACGLKIHHKGHEGHEGKTIKFVAADKAIPFGTKLHVPGYGKAVPVLDRGGAIKGNRLDVYFPSHKEAMNWGVQVLNVKEV